MHRETGKRRMVLRHQEVRAMSGRALLFLLILFLAHHPVSGQSLTGALVGIVRDAQGRLVVGAIVRLTSHAPPGVQTQKTGETGELRFLALSPGDYALDIEAPGFSTLHEGDIRVGTGATLERIVVLQVAGVRESVVVGGSGSRIEARNGGF